MYLAGMRLEFMLKNRYERLVLGSQSDKSCTAYIKSKLNFSSEPEYK